MPRNEYSDRDDEFKVECYVTESPDDSVGPLPILKDKTTCGSQAEAHSEAARMKGEHGGETRIWRRFDNK